MQNKYFDYKHVNLVPKKCIVDSRNECDTTVKLGKNTFMLPVYPANMESIVDVDTCENLARYQHFYTMHRFGVDQVEFVKYFKSEGLFTSISIGVNQDSYELLINLKDQDLEPDYITIDIAHGHSIKMEKMLWFIKNTLLFKSFVIAGNISTVNAANDLRKWKADAIKIGIGGGQVCSTYMETKMGNNGISASIIKEISDWRNQNNYGIKIIADGGIRDRGDISVALTMGADMVMCGGLFAGLVDSPGEVVETEDGLYKLYWGSASKQQSGKTERVEGVQQLIKLKDNSMMQEMQAIQEALQSTISYAGGQDLSIFNTTDYIIKSEN